MALEAGTQIGAKARTQGSFDLHAGVVVRAGNRERLEHLCRYLLRPPLGNERLRTQPGGDVLLQLRRPWSDGTTAIRLTPAELIERLAALVPRPGTNLILYHGVFAANAKWRKRIVPATGPRRAKAAAEGGSNHSWAELMRRGLDIDTLECPSECGGRLRFVAHIEDPAVIRRILKHLDLRAEPLPLAPARGPPEQPELDLSA